MKYSICMMEHSALKYSEPHDGVRCPASGQMKTQPSHWGPQNGLPMPSQSMGYATPLSGLPNMAAKSRVQLWRTGPKLLLPALSLLEVSLPTSKRLVGLTYSAGGQGQGEGGSRGSLVLVLGGPSVLCRGAGTRGRGGQGQLGASTGGA